MADDAAPPITGSAATPVKRPGSVKKVTSGVLALYLSACISGARGPVEPVPLIGGFKSYESMEAVKRRLDPKLPTKIPPPNTPHPDYNLATIEVEGYTHLGHPGTLALHFFNDRLMGTFFYPNNFEQYLAAARSTMPSLALEKRLSLAPYVEVWCFREAGGRHYVAWIDKRLNEEHGNLIKRLT